MEILKGMGSIECYRERKLALELWALLHENKITDLAKRVFDYKTADVYFNTSSGYVFLSDEDYNTVMANGDELDLFISTPYEGREGFFDELIKEFEDMNEEDKQYLKDIATEELKNKHKILKE